MQNILLVEDDPEITRLLKLHFDGSQYGVTSCTTSKQATISMASDTYDLIIMDISLPDGNGLEICKKLRLNDQHTPVMMLTCHSEESDKVLALELGADDYVTKPFGILELMARVKAIIRRAGKLGQSTGTKEIIFQDLMLDASMRKAALKGTRLDLTVKEFDLLYLIASHPGKSFTRKNLLQQVWGITFAGYEHTVTSHINRIRLKIEEDPEHPRYVLTTWGLGYRFAE